MHLFISPHPDDAVLSCGGLIHNLTQQHKQVLILTIMAGDPPSPLPDTPHVKELHQRWGVGVNPMAVRRHEDEEAANILNAEILQVDVLDCIYRTAATLPLYPARDDLFGAVHRDDPARKQIRSLFSGGDSRIDLTRTTPTQIYLPIGIGNHVDHQVVRDVCIDLIQNNDSISALYYQEYPYCEDDAAVEMARSKFPQPITAQDIYLNEDDCNGKCAAVAAHKSQISTFWDDLDDMKQKVRQYMMKVGNGKPAERYWRIID